jgi:nicotinate-nucleotide adenylyltransferase
VGGVAGWGNGPGRLGLLGGTFDPVHYGHLVLAETARVQLELGLVLFAPAGHPPLKPDGPVAGSEHRLAMVEVAIAGNAGFAVSTVDMNRAGPNYTVDTLECLGSDYAGADIYLLIGGDHLATFLSWRDPAGIVSRAKLAVMRRPGWEPDLEELESAIPELAERLVWLAGPSLDIQSSQLRQRREAGLPLRYLVPPVVEEYIEKNGLYGPKERGA